MEQRPHFVHHEIVEQTEWLRRELGRETVHVRVLKSRVEEDEARLAHFLTHYMGQMHDCFLPGSEVPAAYRFVRSEVESEHPCSDRAIQRLYRRLAKVFHPDRKRVAGSQNFQKLQEAYTKKDIHTLAELELMAEEESLSAENEIERLERYERHYQFILNEKDRLLQQHHRLTHGQEWELMVRMNQHGIANHELIGKIKAAIRAELQPA